MGFNRVNQSDVRYAPMTLVDYEPVMADASPR